MHLDLGVLASEADPGAPASVLGRPFGLSPTESVVAADIGTGAPVAVAIVADGTGSVHAIDLGTRWTLPDALSGPTALYLLGGSVISRPGTIVRFKPEGARSFSSEARGLARYGGGQRDRHSRRVRQWRALHSGESWSPRS